MLIKDSKNDWTHKAIIPPDDGEQINFKWHFPRGLLDKRMSGFELAQFVLYHMSGVIKCGLLEGHPRIVAEFEAMFVKLATSPKEVIDQVLSWIRVEWHEQEDDIIHMSLFDQTPQKERKPTFVMPGLN